MNSYQIDRKKWQALSIFEQMGNIYAEVGRTLRAKRQGDEVATQAALCRGLDLFDATAEVWAAKKPGRMQEILRAREVFGAAVLDNTVDPALEQYFMQYAVAARMRQLA